MEKNSKIEDAEQGSGKFKPMSQSDFEKMITRDLQTAMSFLQVVREDHATQRALSEFLYGRYLNQLHKSELEAQQKLEV